MDNYPLDCFKSDVETQLRILRYYLTHNPENPVEITLKRLARIEEMLEDFVSEHS